jgi:hypothetical protein
LQAKALYEDIHCASSDMENRIKECQANLFADRRPAATMRANQLRLWFASSAYVLVCALRRVALAGAEPVQATCGSIRLKLLKIGAGPVQLSHTRASDVLRPETAPQRPNANNRGKAMSLLGRSRRRPWRAPSNEGSKAPQRRAIPNSVRNRAGRRRLAPPCGQVRR